MNCLEFRRHLASEPHSRRVDFVAHREQCGRCAEAHAQALAFEDRLGHVPAVPAPVSHSATPWAQRRTLSYV